MIISFVISNSQHSKLFWTWFLGLTRICGHSTLKKSASPSNLRYSTLSDWILWSNCISFSSLTRIWNLNNSMIIMMFFELNFFISPKFCPSNYYLHLGKTVILAWKVTWTFFSRNLRILSQKFKQLIKKKCHFGPKMAIFGIGINF